MKQILCLAVTMLWTGISVAAMNNTQLKEHLKNTCGKRFDGVNATYQVGLESSLKKRQIQKNYPEKYAEMNELNCRIRIIKNNR